MDPETQAAIAAQSGGAQQPTEPAVKDNQDGEPDAKAQDQVTQTPGASEPPASADNGTQEPAQSDGVDLNMDNKPDPDQALKDAGFDPEAIGKEYGENGGKLTEETEKALRDKFGDETVDAGLQDLKERWDASADERAEKVKEAKGKVDEMNNYIFETLADGDAEKGKENLQILSTWCQDNMDKAELAAINTLLRSGDKAVVKQGLTQAVSAWRKGTEKPMMNGDAAPTSKEPTKPTLEPISRDQYVAIVGTEKYNNDAEYAAKIDERRRATMKQETHLFLPEYSASRPPVR
jgi:hypothetical protein